MNEKKKLYSVPIDRIERAAIFAAVKREKIEFFQQRLSRRIEMGEQIK